MLKNINKIVEYLHLDWIGVSSSSGFFAMNWYIPYTSITHISDPTLSLIARKILGDNSGYNVYLSLRSLARKNPVIWRYTPFILEVTALGETRTGQIIYEVHPINDGIGFPTVILFDSRGQIVPWVRVAYRTDVKVLFLSRYINEFAYDISDSHTVVALQFVEGRCHAPYTDQERYRNRLERIIKKATMSR